MAEVNLEASILTLDLKEDLQELLATVATLLQVTGHLLLILQEVLLAQEEVRLQETTMMMTHLVQALDHHLQEVILQEVLPARLVEVLAHLRIVPVHHLRRPQVPLMVLLPARTTMMTLTALVVPVLGQVQKVLQEGILQGVMDLTKVEVPLRVGHQDIPRGAPHLVLTLSRTPAQVLVQEVHLHVLEARQALQVVDIHQSTLVVIVVDLLVILLAALHQDLTLVEEGALLVIHLEDHLLGLTLSLILVGHLHAGVLQATLQAVHRRIQNHTLAAEEVHLVILQVHLQVHTLNLIQVDHLLVAVLQVTLLAGHLRIPSHTLVVGVLLATLLEARQVLTRAVGVDLQATVVVAVDLPILQVDQGTRQEVVLPVRATVVLLEDLLTLVPVQGMVLAAMEEGVVQDLDTAPQQTMDPQEQPMEGTDLLAQDQNTIDHMVTVHHVRLVLVVDLLARTGLLQAAMEGRGLRMEVQVLDRHLVMVGHLRQVMALNQVMEVVDMVAQNLVMGAPLLVTAVHHQVMAVLLRVAVEDRLPVMVVHLPVMVGQSRLVMVDLRQVTVVHLRQAMVVLLQAVVDLLVTVVLRQAMVVLLRQAMGVLLQAVVGLRQVTVVLLLVMVVHHPVTVVRNHRVMVVLHRVMVAHLRQAMVVRNLPIAVHTPQVPHLLAMEAPALSLVVDAPAMMMTTKK